MDNTTPRTADRPQSKREQREASIERILESALDLMVTNGCNATTVDDIAKRAGLTKGAIYFHFENKTAIVMALLDTVEKLVIGGLLERLAHAGPTSQDKLVAALHSQGLLAETKTKYLLLFTLALLEFSGTGPDRSAYWNGSTTPSGCRAAARAPRQRVPGCRGRCGTRQPRSQYA